MNRRTPPSLEDTGIPRARKGEAAPAVERTSKADPSALPSPEGPAGPGEGGVVTEQAATAVVVEAEPAGKPGMRLVPRKAQSRGEPRSPVTTRLTYGLQDRLFAAATQLGQTQQQIIEDALDAYLARHGL